MRRKAPQEYATNCNICYSSRRTGADYEQAKAAFQCIRPGKDADLVVLDQAMNLRRVIVKGKMLPGPSEEKKIVYP